MKSCNVRTLKRLPVGHVKRIRTCDVVIGPDSQLNYVMPLIETIFWHFHFEMGSIASHDINIVLNNMDTCFRNWARSVWQSKPFVNRNDIDKRMYTEMSTKNDKTNTIIGCEVGNQMTVQTGIVFLIQFADHFRFVSGCKWDMIVFSNDIFSVIFIWVFIPGVDFRTTANEKRWFR